jgi:hypothetical protein
MSSGTNRSPCLHCILNRAMDDYAEAQHKMTRHPVNIDDNVDDLLACVCEMLAWIDDGKERRAVAKRYASLLVKRVSAFREIGRYPGGPWTTQAPLH